MSKNPASDPRVALKRPRLSIRFVPQTSSCIDVMSYVSLRAKVSVIESNGYWYGVAECDGN